MRGADIVLAPTAVSEEDLIDFVISSHAYENDLYVAYVNQRGGGFGGGSLCSDPEGKVVVRGKTREEEILLVRSNQDLLPI